MAQTLTQLGKYRIERELGRGAMGVVYQAFDPVVERMVAIKTIRVEADDTGELVARLRREAKSVGQLEHPNIVTLYDAGESGGLFYLAMQFISGETLQDRLARQRWFSLNEVADIFGQICAGLDYAHQHKVIHRDIKPANIMITHEGVVKLTDFGIAKVAGAGTTSTGLVVGTPSYMSPEQALGKPLDGRSDIFSLGSILYEMMTGEMAFPGQNVTTVMYKIVHETPTPLAALQPGLDPAIEAVVLKALAKHPEQRFQTCSELAAALQYYISQVGAAAPQTAVAYVPPIAPPVVAPARPPSGAVPGVVAPRPPSGAQPPAPASYPGVAPAAPGSSPGTAPVWPTPGSGAVPAAAVSASTASQPVAARSGVPFAWLGGGVVGTLLLVIVILLVVQMRQPVPGPSPATQPAANVAQPAANADQPAAPPTGTTVQPAVTQPVERAAEVKPEPAKPPNAISAADRSSRAAARRDTPAVSRSVPQSAPAVATRPASDSAPHTASVSNGLSKLAEPAPTTAPAAAEPEPQNYQAAMLKGDLAYQAGDYQKALAAYLKAYRMKPDSRGVKTKLRTVLHLLGRPEDAQKYR
jgi:tRNA A-37 threonylcarbamoyl transferase component Bud32